MRRNKYHAKHVIMGKLKFASRAEAARYLILSDMQKRGEIRNLVMQPTYELTTHVTYRADYAYDAQIKGAGWVRVVEDVKGIETSVFSVKKRLMADILGIEVQVIRMRSKDVNNLLAAARVV